MNRLKIPGQQIERLGSTRRTRESSGSWQRIRRSDLVFGEPPQEIAAALYNEPDATGAVREHETSHLVGIGALIGADVGAANRGTDQHVRAFLAHDLQKVVQIG